MNILKNFIFNITRFIFARIFFNSYMLDILIKVLYLMLDRDAKEYLNAHNENNYKNFIASVHHSYGRMLRNDLKLWNESSKIVMWFKERYGISHADDISTLIIIALIFRKNVKMRDKIMKTEVKTFKEHWEKFT